MEQKIYTESEINANYAWSTKLVPSVFYQVFGLDNTWFWDDEGLNYVFDSGTKEVDETKVKVNENELVTPLSVSKEGYNFEGWYLNDKEFDFDTKITSNLTLTAKYNKKIGWTEIAIVLVGAVILYKVNPKKLKKEVKKIMK